MGRGTEEPMRECFAVVYGEHTGCKLVRYPFYVLETRKYPLAARPWLHVTLGLAQICFIAERRPGLHCIRLKRGCVAWPSRPASGIRTFVAAFGLYPFLDFSPFQRLVLSWVGRRMPPALQRVQIGRRMG